MVTGKLSCVLQMTMQLVWNNKAFKQVIKLTNITQAWSTNLMAKLILSFQWLFIKCTGFNQLAPRLEYFAMLGTQGDRGILSEAILYDTLSLILHLLIFLLMQG